MSDAGLLERYVHEYAAGEVIFREGEPGREMYVIQSGAVEISREISQRHQVLAVLHAGEFFGEMAIVNDRPRSATATIKDRARLLVVDSHTFEEMLRRKTEIALRLIKALAGRLERANQQVELLLLRHGNHRVVQCLRQLADDYSVDGATEVFIPLPHTAIADRVALPPDEVMDILQRLALARLVVHSSETSVDGDGYVVPELGRLREFLEFLELRDRFGD
jgi:CRP/FNR family transcriptional regulator, cyclic AMP receptor protein